MQRMPTPPAQPNPRRLAASTMEASPVEGAEGGARGEEGQDEEAEETATAMAQAPLPFNATIEPLMVHPPSVQHARTPSLQECHIIMKHLVKISDKQAHEVS